MIIVVVLSLLIGLACPFPFWLREMNSMCLKDSMFQGLSQWMIGVEEQSQLKAVLSRVWSKRRA
ncbi:hypothetical protein [Prosthecobacter sp.]|uniref:hypothetical protein n=1 Tax=Prosthecobacter sp. TaxID=1965333 RepID=UPI003783744F